MTALRSTGAGALNIDGGRVGSASTRRTSNAGTNGDGRGTGASANLNGSDCGRWPSNLILDEDTARSLDGQSGFLHGAGNVKESWITTESPNGFLQGLKSQFRNPNYHKNDGGGASRFSHCTDWNAETEERLGECDPLFYAAKASRAERNAGCSHLAAQSWIDGAAVPNRAIRPNRANANNHPCVKPIKLTQHLATLLLPPCEYSPRESGAFQWQRSSEMVGAMRAGWDEIVGIEGEAEYVEITKARLRFHGGLFCD